MKTLAVGTTEISAINLRFNYQISDAARSVVAAAALQLSDQCDGLVFDVQSVAQLRFLKICLPARRRILVGVPLEQLAYL